MEALHSAHRILEPTSSQVDLDNIAIKKPLPYEIKTDLTSQVDCIAGAVTLDDSEYHAGCGQAPPSESLPQKPAYEMNESSYQTYPVKNDGTPGGNQSIAPRQWWDAYPAVKSSPSSITDEELAMLIRNSSATANFAVIDVRRNDHAGGYIRGSYNWAAQTFYDDLPNFFHEFRNTPQVIFYCGSSKGRGPRCAGWYQDYLNDNADFKSTSQAYVLDGGIKNWLSKFSGEDDLVDRD